MKKTLPILVAAFVLTAAAAERPRFEHTGPQARVVALTFDDLVGQSTSRTTETYASITAGILSALEEANAPAIGFVNEEKLYVDDQLQEDRVAIIRSWLERGFELGNHTFSHPNLHAVPVEEWLADFRRGDAVLSTLWASHPPTTRYLRHPYLRTGRTVEVKEQVARALHVEGYAVAPVTIDNQEWVFARAFDVALDRSDAEAARRVELEYLEYMDAMFSYYEAQSEAILGRELRHVLLLHANRLNASALPQLLTVIRDRGYAFATLDAVLEDPAYERLDGYFGPAGITWLHRWALAAGMPGSTFAGEPGVSDFVQQLSGL